ncbi:MAG TPA: UDP-N-acetylmuramoyl-L-alanyl-D-glutamate--2,6-diaminopimelate ligase [Candidatus Moranbacteria bacterium]|nr:UDP-N-acetylmuramoyl-L-alanyl-D-glutamate--2,6-diaminopimelate ligase [Candidatus Moranbacteria bacterium]HRZ33477.1 UDP-N-acetylmuramoyl-L-alanyl-D-glutamate--2,6-diaminopimelate ligase [Candidatus Moranbacteria bacterium]
MKKIIPQSIKNVYHLSQAIMANFLYGFPSHRIKIIGVTGTNGKTTTVQMIAKILEENGFKTAVASTINFKLGSEEWVNKTKFTTLSSFAVQKFIKKSVQAGCKYLVLETSSHSLDQYRVWGVKYETAVITNVTREHLDYHKTMKEYRKVKSELFKKANNAIINLDMENPGEFLNISTGKKITYSLKNNKADILAKNISLNPSGTKFSVKNTEINLKLLGEFNIENALAAICVGISEEINMEIIKNSLEKIKLVPGRMENIPNKRKINIIIDYAVTPDSLEKLYQLINHINTSRSKIIAVFGSCGERDRGKRPIMGEIVSKYADYIIVTNEDPYNENPIRVIDEVASGIRNKIEGEKFWKILDRKEAIKKALILSKEGDFVIVTGKGAEETMAVGKKRIPWNDRRIIEEELESLS